MSPRSQAANTVVDEPMPPLPEPISWNVENARDQYARFHEARREEKDLDPKIERTAADITSLEQQLISRIKEIKAELEPLIEKGREDLDHLKKAKANLGRVQLKHKANAETLHRMALRECEEAGYEPKPPTFEAFAAHLDEAEARLAMDATALHAIAERP